MKQDEFKKLHKEFYGFNADMSGENDVELFNFINHLLSKQKPSVSDEEIKNKAEETYKHSIIEERAFQNGAKWALSLTPPDAEKWISVDERLPENEDDVLVFVDYGGVQTKIEQAYYFEKDWYWLNDSYIVYKVTHWMHLPKPPINKQGGK